MNKQMERDIMLMTQKDFLHKYGMTRAELTKVLKREYGQTAYIAVRVMIRERYIEKNHETMSIRRIVEHTGTSYSKVIKKIKEITGKKVRYISQVADSKTIQENIERMRGQNSIKFVERIFAPNVIIKNPEKVKLIRKRGKILLSYYNKKIAELSYQNIQDPVEVCDRIKEFVNKYVGSEKITEKILKKY